MPREPIHETIAIRAPIERCWALSTHIELVQKTLGMRPIDGVTHGFITEGSRVVWRGWKFGLPTRHHTLITRFEPPHNSFLHLGSHQIIKEALFQDTQEKGRFAEFHHDHFFREVVSEGKATPEATNAGHLTVLTDEVHFRLPLGFLGELVAGRLMTSFICKLTQRRFALLKELAEGDGWRTWLEPEDSASTP